MQIRELPGPNNNYTYVLLRSPVTTAAEAAAAGILYRNLTIHKIRLVNTTRAVYTHTLI